MLGAVFLALPPLLVTGCTIVRSIQKKTISNILVLHIFFLTVLFLTSLKPVIFSSPISPYPFYIILTCMEMEYAARNADSQYMVFALYPFLLISPPNTATAWLCIATIFLPNPLNFFIQESKCSKKTKKVFQYGTIAFLGGAVLCELSIAGFGLLK